MLSGLLLGLSFPPFPFAPLAWFALVPLLFSWDRHSSARTAFLEAYVAFLTTFAVAFHWPLLHVFAETAWLSLPGLLVIPMWMALPIGLSIVYRRKLGGTAGLIVLIALVIVIELALRRGPLAFPWTLLGHTQAAFYPINTLAAFGGVPLLTAYVLIVNALVYRLITGGRLRTAVIGFVFVAVPFFPWHNPAEQADEDLTLGIVQPAISAWAWADVEDTSRVAMLLRMTSELTSDVDLVLWPETAIPPGVASVRHVRRAIDTSDVPLLAGAIVAGEREGFYRNAALLFRPGEATQPYFKERLVPFAEHVPLQERWPWMRRLAVPSGGVRGYVPGRENEALEIQGHPFGVQICFETLFDDAARSFARRDARLIVALTQDGWWRDSFGYRQHLAFNRLRAIETGLPIVQSSVSGISALILPDGQVTRASGWMERTTTIVRIPPRLERTIFTAWGEWITPTAVIVLLAATAFFAIRRTG